MKTSESIVNIATALAKAQANFEAALKDARNPHFKSKFADLGSVLDAVLPSLHAEGISMLQPHKHENGRNFVVTVLLHRSGEFLMSETEIVTSKDRDPQSLGSSITYARRYGLQSMCGIKAEDDDGERATTRDDDKPKASYQAPRPTPTPSAAPSPIGKPAVAAPVATAPKPVSNVTVVGQAPAAVLAAPVVTSAPVVAAPITATEPTPPAPEASETPKAGGFRGRARTAGAEAQASSVASPVKSGGGY